MSVPTVTNLRSPRSGDPVANQYEIAINGAYYFQSYQTLIAKKEGATFTISSNHNYSRTTSKYFTGWLQDNGLYPEEVAAVKKWLKKANDGDTYDELERHSVVYVEELK